MKLRFFLFAFCLGFMVACASPDSSLIPTPYPPEYLPTVVALTAQAIGQEASDSATSTIVATIPTEIETEPFDAPEPTLNPTPGPTRTPTAIPGHKLATLQFIAPGPMSRVVSPINLKMNVLSGESKRLEIDLYGEDGRLISRTLRRNVPQSRGGLFMTMKIPFEIRAQAEVGRITISTFDNEGRIQALNSVRVILLSSGENEITPAGNPSEPIGVVSPLDEEAVAGGVLTVRGDVWPYNTQPVILELLNNTGNSIGLRILTMNGINPQTFTTTIPYSVSETTLARLTIRQDDDRMPGLFYVYSQLVELNP